MNLLLFRVLHDGRGLHWEVSDIFVLLTISHVELTPLALPEVRHSAGPDRRFDNNDAVLLETVVRVSHLVGHLVTVASKDPCRVVALAGAVLCDGLETTLIRVSSQEAIHFLVTVFSLFTN